MNWRNEYPDEDYEENLNLEHDEYFGNCFRSRADDDEGEEENSSENSDNEYYQDNNENRLASYMKKSCIIGKFPFLLF